MRKGFLGGVGLAVIIVAGLICVAKCTVIRTSTPNNTGVKVFTISSQVYPV